MPFLSGGLAFSELGLNLTAMGVAGPNSGAYGQNSLGDMRVYYQVPTVTLVTNGYLRGAPVTNSTFRFAGSGNLASLGVNYHF